VNSVLVVGGSDKAFVAVNKTFAAYTITSNTSYNIALDGFGAGANYTYVNYTIAHSANNTNEAIYA
jgi:hypothetical protein